MHNSCQIPDGFGSKIFTGVVTVLMGIVTMVRLTKNMPKKLADSTFYSSPDYCDDDSVSGAAKLQSQVTAMSVVKRMAELEERVAVLSMRPVSMPPEKEAMLNSALSRIEALEQDLIATRKVLIDI